MYIIFGKENAETLRERHIVLELETFAGENQDPPKTAYCVVQPGSIALGHFPDIDRFSSLHQATVDAWNRQDYSTVKEGIGHLTGQFGGELDSFYDILTQRIAEKENV